MAAPSGVQPVNKPLIIFVGGFFDQTLVHAMVRVFRDYDNPVQAKVYYSHDKGEAIYRQIVEWKEKTGQPVALIGHSYGGDTVVRVAERLGRERDDQPIDLLISLDPVSRRGGMPKAAIHSAKRWFNARVADPWKRLSIPNIVALIGGHWKTLSHLGCIEREHEIHPPFDHVHIHALLEPFMEEVRNLKPVSPPPS